jgi:hypothetical protein
MSEFMENKGIENYSYLRITDLGYEKGETLASGDTIQVVYEKALQVQLH